MGYRSEVALVLSKKDYVYGIKWFEQNNLGEDENLLLAKNADKVIERDDTIIIHYGSIKWYKTIIPYVSIIHLYDFLHTIGYERFSIIRLGEEVEDIEIEGDISIAYDSSVYPVTMIELNEWKNDIKVDMERMNKLLEEDKYYHIYCKTGKSKVGKASWLT